MSEIPIIRHFQGYVNGQWTDGSAAGAFAVRNPATGVKLADLPDMGSAGATAAVKAAAACDPAMGLAERRALLTRLADALTERRELFARIITLEQGKPLREALAETDYGIGFFRFYAEHLDRLDADDRGRDGIGSWQVHARPAGVCALITPWNFPFTLLAKKLSAALAAGCSVVAKPAELTPLSAVAVCHVLDGLDLPRGMVNLVVGMPEPIGAVFCAHPAVAVISFTGSTEVGRLLMEQSAAQVKRLALELGGNAPFVVFEDADLERAADQLLYSRFRCAGQTCVCANRILVQRGAEDRFLDVLRPKVAALRVGDGLEEGVDLGPLINRETFDKARGLLVDALEHGAKLVHGQVPQPPQSDYGFFFPPVMIRDVTAAMNIWRDEIFGPVVSVASFEDEADAVRLGNDTIHGLAAYIFSSDPQKLQRVAAKLRFGHVGLNSGSGPRPQTPFGGMKQSGLGREGGVEGLFEFCEIQTMVTHD